MKKVLLGGLAGGLVIFIVNAISWVLLPFHSDAMNSLPATDAELAPLLAKLEAAGDGVYHYPQEDKDLEDPEAAQKERERWAKKYESGPVITFMMFRKKGGNPMPPMNFAIGFLGQFLAACVAAMLLKAAGLKSFRARAAFVFGCGIFAVCATQIETSMWWKLSPEFFLPIIGDLVVGWGLAGLVMARIVKEGGG